MSWLRVVDRNAVMDRMLDFALFVTNPFTVSFGDESWSALKITSDLSVFFLTVTKFTIHNMLRSDRTVVDGLFFAWLLLVGIFIDALGHNLFAKMFLIKKFFNNCSSVKTNFSTYHLCVDFAYGFIQVASLIRQPILFRELSKGS